MDAITAARVGEDRAPWSFVDTAVGAILTLIPLIALNLVNNAAAGNMTLPKLTPSQDLTNAIITFILTALLEGIFLIAPIINARRRARGEEGRALGLRGFNPALALVLIILSYAVVIVASNGIEALNNRFNFSAPTNAEQIIKSELHAAPLTLLATLIAATVVAPICEELFFRSYLMQGLRTVMPAWLAVPVSALIFAFAHLSPGSFALLLVLGILLGALRVWTRSVWPGIVLHAVNNGFVLIYVVQLLGMHK